MQIMKTVKKVPGGLMLVPLLLGALVHTFTPGAGEYLGGFTNGLITGTTPILAVWLFCIGASISLKASGMVLRKSGTLVLTKILVAWVVVAIGLQFLPIEGIQNGIFAGYSVLALVVAFDMTNAGLFASLMQQYGTKEDAGAFVLMSLEAGPLVSMLILGSTGAAYFEPQLFVGAILPFLIGFLLGNLDPECNKFFSRATETIIPFFGFALGNNIDLSVITKTGISGISLALLVIVVSGIPLMLADKFIGKGDGTAGLAASAVAGQAVANPMIIAELKPEFLPAAQSATAMVATAMVVTAILVPILTAYYTKWAQKRFKSTIVSVDTTKESSANT